MSKSAIENIEETNLIKQNLKKKLASVYKHKMLADITVHPQHKNNVEKLAEAINTKRQIVLHNYQSANSNSVQDRVVEPFKFTTNLVQVWCFEPASKANKLFNIARIGEVSITNQTWKHESEHDGGYIDIFRIASNQKMPIKLALSMRAANLLREEYPLSEKDMKQQDDCTWLLETEVCSYEDVGRFVLVLYDYIQIIESPRFQTYIDKRIHAFTQKLRES